VIASGGLGRFDLPALWPSATILNGLGRLLISQGFLPKSDTNGRFQGREARGWNRQLDL
jgi:hypothetical protein